jgi:hypothetical protein
MMMRGRCRCLLRLWLETKEILEDCWWGCRLDVLGALLHFGLRVRLLNACGQDPSSHHWDLSVPLGWNDAFQVQFERCPRQ